MAFWRVGRLRRCYKTVAILALLIMAACNILYIYDLIHHHDILQLKPNGLDVHPLHKTRSKDSTRKTIKIKVFSGKEKAEIYVNDKEVHVSEEQTRARGIHVAVLNQATGEAMAVRVFDTYLPGNEETLVSFLDSVMDERILCFVIADEGTFFLKDVGRSYLEALGSKASSTLHWRDTWVFVAAKVGVVYGEDVGKAIDLQHWGQNLQMTLLVPSSESSLSCDWPDTAENEKRKTFCSLYDGYGSLCACDNPLSIDLTPPPLSPSNIADIPVVVMASNRAEYLFRMLQTLLRTRGANRELIVVAIDGYYKEPEAVAKLMGVASFQHEPKSQRNGRIAQHYKASLTNMFDTFPSAKYVIVLEEDLEISPDFFSYFSQTVHLMEEDSSLYCISAWNDQGYKHTTHDPGLLYRVDTMPGLGWLLGRKLYKEELEPKWPTPDKLWDWDMWMRTDYMRKGRECVIPDISRTFHFGKSGTNMNPYFHDRYFKNHILNQIPDVVMKDTDKMVQEKYEIVIENLLQKAVPVDHSVPTTSDAFIPSAEGIYVVYIAKENAADWESWIVLASHFKIWDLDARGFHKGLWRLWINNNQVLIVGCPFSKYCSFKPQDLTPIKLEKPKKQ